MRCGQRRNSFWDDPGGDVQTYGDFHNAKPFDLHFILKIAILLKWMPDLIMNGLKIMCMKMEHHVFLNSVSFLPVHFARCQSISIWKPPNRGTHYFNTEENLDYVGPIPDITSTEWTRCAEGERNEFLALYEIQKSEIFDNRLVL